MRIARRMSAYFWICREALKFFFYLCAAMANPKRKHSKSRRDKRRTHHKLDAPAYYIDQQSGEPTLFHRVNLISGYYRGKKVLRTAEDDEA